MPTAILGAAALHYEVLGSRGSWVAIVQGGRHSLDDVASLAKAIAALGHRVLIHDRRNCGRSSLDFEFTAPEDHQWAADLVAVMEQIGAAPAVVVGKSRGVRIALRTHLHHPGAVSGLVLWGLSGGRAAVRFLDDYYYGRYLRAVREGGMTAVCDLDHFAALIRTTPEHRTALLSMDAARFTTTMQRWRRAFLRGKNHPVMGVPDAELRAVSVPTAIIPYYDRLHPHAVAVHAAQSIPGARFFDFAPERRDDRVMLDESADVPDIAAIVAGFAATV